MLRWSATSSRWKMRRESSTRSTEMRQVEHKEHRDEAKLQQRSLGRSVTLRKLHAKLPFTALALNSRARHASPPTSVVLKPPSHHFPPSSLHQPRATQQPQSPTLKAIHPHNSSTPTPHSACRTSSTRSKTPSPVTSTVITVSFLPPHLLLD